MDNVNDCGWESSVTIIGNDADLIAWAIRHDIACDDGTPTVDEIVAAINDPDSDSEIGHIGDDWAIIDG